MLVITLIILGFAAFLFGEANEAILYPFDATEEAPSETHLPNMAVKLIQGPEGRTVVWSSPAQRGMPVIFYLHGNAGNLADRTGRFQRLSRADFGIWATAYPGSSGSEGTPSEERLIQTASKSFAELRASQSNETPIVVYGESLGAAVAIGLIESLTETEDPLPEGIVLEAPFTSVADVGENLVGSFASLAVPYLDSWRSLDRAKEVLQIPLIVIHGAQDALIPAIQGQNLFEAAPSEHKKLLLDPSGDHVNLWSGTHGKELLRRMGQPNFGL